MIIWPPLKSTLFFITLDRSARIKPLRAEILTLNNFSILRIPINRLRTVLISGKGEIGWTVSVSKPADSKKVRHSESVYSCSPLSRREKGLSAGNPFFSSQTV